MPHPLPTAARRRARPLRAALPALALLASCSSADPAGPGAACPGPLTLTVGAGTRPSVGWAPACAVQGVTVAESAAGGGPTFPLWQAQATVGEGVTPPVQVGGRPAGASVFGAGEALTVGAAYTVYVVRGTRASGASVDSLTFTARSSP